MTAMLVIWFGTGAMKPPFPYRTRFVPQREVVARVAFEFHDKAATAEQQGIAVSKMRCIYRNDPAKLDIVTNGLIEKLYEVLSEDGYNAKLWSSFFAKSEQEEEIEPVFATFRAELERDPRLDKIKKSINESMKLFRRRGVLQSLQHEVFQGSNTTILVYGDDDPENLQVFEVSDVRILELFLPLRDSFHDQLQQQDAFENVDLLADRIARWIFEQLPNHQTLIFDKERTEQKRAKIRDEVSVVLRPYVPGDRMVYDLERAEGRQGIIAGKPLVNSDIEILMAEHEAYCNQLTTFEKLIYSLADFGLYLAVFLLCGAYMYFRQRDLIRDFGKFCLVVFSFATTIVLAWWIDDSWRAEIVPIAVFAMVISIAYRHEVALILGACVSLVVTYSLGLGLTDFVVFVSAATTGSFLCNDISSRTRLVYVGIFMALITFATAMGSGVLGGQAIIWENVVANQLLIAAWYGFCAFLSGLLITVFLPFVELLFDVQTDLSLLEWSDPSHELLHKMIQRAPGTYNHSINVASIAETAADEIGANGLLCRVSAYYHDIGKLIKPEYFVENQTSGENKHDSLVPAMSALVIIAHVKDGVELAKKHRLPKSMIDMIKQHHGTTRVEYFYSQAGKEAEANGEKEEVDEANFLYPGPKPQTKEACVMMLADSVESACRSLTEPAPARIETLVKEISSRKLNDDQFSESPLTLRELHLIEQSLIKSLISVYHSRVKYPEQQGE